MFFFVRLHGSFHTPHKKREKKSHIHTHIRMIKINIINMKPNEVGIKIKSRKINNFIQKM